MEESHPIIVHFGKTDAANFPLILAVGREPNSDQVVVNRVGQYDFRASPRCGFWNISYGMLAREANLSTHEFKQLCIRKSGSPLVYADLLPQGLLNRVVDKHVSRSKISDKDMIDHIANLFSHRQLIDRVQLVILSGVQASIFNAARKSVEQRCEKELIPFIHLPFFFGTNTQKIQQTLTVNDKKRLKLIFDQFNQDECFRAI